MQGTKQLGALVATLVTTGGCAAAPDTVDGIWSAALDGQSGELTMTLTVRNEAISGSGRSTAGALKPAAFRVSGTYRPPTLRLTWTYDNGETRTLTATVVEREKMVAKLVWAGGTVQHLTFVRP